MVVICLSGGFGWVWLVGGVGVGGGRDGGEGDWNGVR